MIKKLILAIALTTVSPSVMAEWTLIAVNSDYGLNVYVDYATIRRVGNKVKMWRLFDYKTVQIAIRKEWLSDITQEEFDCQAETSRILATSWYSRNMGNGEVVYSNGSFEGTSTPIIPNAMSEFTWKAACKNQ